MDKSSSSDAPASTLDSIVTKLQWAAVGKSEDINSGADIDKYVSELILEEAKKSNNLYNKLGPRAYLDPTTGSEPCTLRKTNKTFLRNIVRNTNCHNRIIERSSTNNINKSDKKPYSRNKREGDRYRSISPRRKEKSSHSKEEGRHSSKKQKHNNSERHSSSNSSRPK